MKLFIKSIIDLLENVFHWILYLSIGAIALIPIGLPLLEYSQFVWYDSAMIAFTIISMIVGRIVYIKFK